MSVKNANATVVHLVPRASRHDPDRKGGAVPGEIDLVRLVAAAVAREPWAQSTIFDLNVRVVRSVLRRTLGPGIDVEDALQETFLQFFRSVERLENPNVLRSFLIGIALRVAASERRRRRIKRWLTLTPKGDLADVAGLAPDEKGRAALRRLYAILDELDEESRLLFVLRHVEQLALDDMALATGLSLSTIKRRLARVEPVIAAKARREPLLCVYTEGAGASVLGSIAVGEDRS